MTTQKLRVRYKHGKRPKDLDADPKEIMKHPEAVNIQYHDGEGFVLLAVRRDGEWVDANQQAINPPDD